MRFLDVPGEVNLRTIARAELAYAKAEAGSTSPVHATLDAAASGRSSGLRCD